MILTTIYATSSSGLILMLSAGNFRGGGFVILTIGAVLALLGVICALMEHDPKSLLTDHSVKNVGIIPRGIGAAMILRFHGLKSLPC
jgi:formate hydrogenlyase subunit 3/multisubunit Na+/H+ antiporter MnhD subunit